jgi:hypothetical protein
VNRDVPCPDIFVATSNELFHRAIFAQHQSPVLREFPSHLSPKDDHPELETSNLLQSKVSLFIPNLFYWEVGVGIGLKYGNSTTAALVHGTGTKNIV